MSVTLPESYYLRSETVLHVITRTQLQQRQLYAESKVQTLLHACVVNDTRCCHMGEQRLLQRAPASLSPEGLGQTPTGCCHCRPCPAGPRPNTAPAGARDGSPGRWPGRSPSARQRSDCREPRHLHLHTQRSTKFLNLRGLVSSNKQ